MVASATQDVGPGLIEQSRLRFAYAVAGANAVGALIVFLFLTFVLPNPADVQHPTRVLVLNAAVFAVVSVIGFPLVWRRSARLWTNSLAWIRAGREPDARELEKTLRLPLEQQKIVAVAWITSAIIFTALNSPFSLELASGVAIGILLGCLVTCALGYLLGERLMRPITALCLSTGEPGRPQLPGVAARTLLSWTLGPGVVLLALALVATSAFDHKHHFTVHRLAIVILILTVLGMLVGLAMMTALARSLADPITSLRQAMARVEQGELDQEVPVDDASEVGLLQAGFNRMLAGLRERERIRDLFGRQVGEDVVRRALDRGVELGGEARDAGVLFVDLEGSTALAETHDPAQVVSLLNSFFAVVVEVAAAHHGWVNKFEGDAALCVFGAPLPDPRAATHALAAARGLRGRLAADVPAVRAGIGVSAGRVVAGNIGAAKRFEYTVIGDPVNEAARLTELAKRTERRVLASEAVLGRAEAEEASHWQVEGEVTLRGRAEPTRIASPLTDAKPSTPEGEKLAPVAELGG